MLEGRRRLRHAWGLAAWVAGIGCTRVARADDAIDLSVEYEVPQGCPDRGAFLREVRARVTHWPPSSSIARDAIRVRIDEADSAAAHATGVLVIATDGGAVSEREVAGESCADVAAALAAFLALALDVAWIAAQDRSAGTEEQGPAAPPAPPPAPPSSAAARRRSPSAPAAPPRPSARWSGWARAGMLSGTADDFAPHLGFGAELARRDTRSGPVARLGMAVATSPRREVSTGSVAFSWAASTLDLCLASSRGRWTVRSCLAAELGALLGQSFDLAVSKAGVRPRVAAGSKGTIAFALRPPWAIELDVGAVVPFVRVPFLVEGRPTFEPPVVAFRAAAGVAYRFR